MAFEIPADCRYAENHEWIRVSDDTATVGISDFAQQELTDVVYVELPEEGKSLDQGEPFAVVESVKAASDVYMPVSGEIVEVNEALEDSPELVNDDPYGEGWFVRIRIADPAELDALMDPDDYRAFVDSQAE
jgi:glycine cleavage system H protein